LLYRDVEFDERKFFFVILVEILSLINYI